MPDLKPQDVIEVLTQDHREVEEMFAKLESMGPATTDAQRKRRKDLVDQVTIELVRHSVAEEAEVYPAVQDKLTKREAERARKEHAEAEQTMKRLEGLEPEDEGFDAELATLMREIREHVKEEEGEMFPRMREVFTQDELDKLGSRVKGVKALAPTRPHPSAPDTAAGRPAAGPGRRPLRPAARRGVQARHRALSPAPSGHSRRWSRTSSSCPVRDRRRHPGAVRLAAAVGRRPGVEQPQPSGCRRVPGDVAVPEDQDVDARVQGVAALLATPGLAGLVDHGDRQPRHVDAGHLRQARAQLGAVVVAVAADETPGAALQRVEQRDVDPVAGVQHDVRLADGGPHRLGEVAGPHAGGGCRPAGAGGSATLMSPAYPSGRSRGNGGWVPRRRVAGGWPWTTWVRSGTRRRRWTLASRSCPGRWCAR